MANMTLTSAQVGEFCESMALMLSVGITLAEGSSMLACGYGEDTAERSVLMALYRPLAQGSSLADAMEASGAFPAYASSMVRNGERTGRLEATLRSLARYYEEQARLFARVRTAVAYPCALLCVMSVILAFCVIGILPVFSGVYDTMAGGLAASSAALVGAGMVVGWTALAITLVLTVFALFVFISCRSERGRARLLRAGQKLPGLRGALHAIALSRFMATLAVYVASGSHSDEAVASALAAVEHEGLKERVAAAHEEMIRPIRPLGLVHALTQHGGIDELAARMLEFGTRTGQMDAGLSKLGDSLFDDGIERLDRVIDMVEPVLVALLTVAIGTTLVAAMLPLVGILGTIG